MNVAFATFRAADAVAIRVQPSQWVQAGIDMRELDPAQARDLEEQSIAWTARAADGRILCCAGFIETLAGVRANAWAMLAAGLGVRQHLAITRYARARIAESMLPRIECLTNDDGRCIKWAVAVGLQFRARLECWGANAEDVLLFDRIRRSAPCRP